MPFVLEFESCPRFGLANVFIALQTVNGCNQMPSTQNIPGGGTPECLVREEVREYKRGAKTEVSRRMTKPAKLDTSSSEEKVETSREELRPEDFYYEGPYLVFTAAYHLKRGYCCNSDCRHCPYK